MSGIGELRGVNAPERCGLERRVATGRSAKKHRVGGGLGPYLLDGAALWRECRSVECLSLDFPYIVSLPAPPMVWDARAFLGVQFCQ